jgi:hypothetical protein
MANDLVWRGYSSCCICLGTFVSSIMGVFSLFHSFLHSLDSDQAGRWEYSTCFWYRKGTH